MSIETSFRPSRAYWHKIAGLDRVLFDRGARVASNFNAAERLFSRQIEWREDANDFLYVTGPVPTNSLRVLHLGAHLLRATNGVSDQHNPIWPVRMVEFFPSGIFTFLGHAVSDCRYSLEGVESSQGFDIRRDPPLKPIADEIRQYQKAVGYALPNRETYDYIEQTLMQGEVSTRFF